ncbi:protein ITPRID2 isoform X2 [Clinocottus analis]|uniref:protein ITPRID2 isoform X2 n=1 Tax=Clinocottus analis TaxID=304258 RepID=UPI0035BF9E0C
MESGPLGMDTNIAPGPRVQSNCSLAFLRRRAWAQSKDSTWQESEAESCGPQGPQENQGDGEEQRPSEEPGRVPNNIASWLIECRTPLAASLDDQTPSPSKGVLKNGCSFEDDLSLGAEANHLQSRNDKTESCFGLAADQKRTQYKEGARSMNSTGSGKSSTVSSVSELLDLYEENPEEILLNLGFGREEPDPASKVPSRFFSNSSTARGIDIKVYLGAQLQRMEVENPNYALTSRFRQIEVLTTVANEFFNLYSQVSGQSVQCISSKDQGGEGKGDESTLPVKRNVAKLIKKITKRNLFAANPESLEAHAPNQQTQLNGHATSDQTNTNGHTHGAPEKDGCSTDHDHQAETINQNHMRKKDSCPLATVTEETNGDGDDSPEQSRTGPTSNGEHQPGAADSQSPNGRTAEGTQAEEKILTSTPEKTPPTLARLQLAQLRSENTDSFDMEEIQSNEDEALPLRTSRGTDLLRTVSQQSDSSGFAEEPPADSNSYLKVQESSDSCDSETTVTSHPSLDVATPLAMDHPAFEMPDSQEEEAEPAVAAESDGSSNSREEDKHDGSTEQMTQYTAHHLPRNKPMGKQQGGTGEEEQVEGGDQTNPEPEPEQNTSQSMSAVEQEQQPELVDTQNQTASEQEHTQNPTETATDTKPPTEAVDADDEAQEEHAFLSDYGSLPAPSSPVLSALIRAKQKEQRVDLQSVDFPLLQSRRRRGIPLQRSSSLPTALSSPSRIVSSVRIQFGQGQASCTKPRYSYKYSCDGEGEDEEEEEEEEKGQTNCLSTLIINPTLSSDSNNQPPRLPTEAPIRPKPIPRYLLRSTCSLHSCSSPPDVSPGDHAYSWSTQSVPDLTSNQHPPGKLQQNMKANRNQQNGNPGHTMFRYPNPNPTAQYAHPSPNPSPSLNPSPYPFPLNPTPQYPSPLHPYASLPNLLHHHNLTHHSSLASLYQPTTSAVPQHGSLSSLHHPSTPAVSHNFNMGNLHPGTPEMHHQAYNQLYDHQSPYHATPHGSQFASPYLGNHVYNMNPHQAFPYPPLAPEHCLHPGFAPPPGFYPGMASTIGPGHSLHPGFAPSAPGFFPGLASSHSPGHSFHPGLTPHAAPSPGPSQGPSSTEMQLRRVLHDIRGTVQSLSQKQVDTPDAFSEHRAALPIHQSLAEFQQKRQSLNLFRSQMTDLEHSIVRQQALVYKHLSPADRMEVEQLQSLRSSVREELQELEQQLEDRLMELTHHTQHRGLHSDSSFDSQSTTSALRAMEPVSDLLREQLILQSELSYGSHTPSTQPSSRSSSPVPGGGEGEQKGGVYRASININPVPAPRPNAHTEEEEREEGESDAGGVPEEEGATGGIRVGNLEQLIREIRENVAQEVRQEIYSELLAAVSPRRSPLPRRQRPL